MHIKCMYAQSTVICVSVFLGLPADAGLDTGHYFGYWPGSPSSYFQRLAKDGWWYVPLACVSNVPFTNKYFTSLFKWHSSHCTNCFSTQPFRTCLQFTPPYKRKFVLFNHKRKLVNYFFFSSFLKSSSVLICYVVCVLCVMC